MRMNTCIFSGIDVGIPCDQNIDNLTNDSQTLRLFSARSNYERRMTACARFQIIVNDCHSLCQICLIVAIRPQLIVKNLHAAFNVSHLK